MTTKEEKNKDKKFNNLYASQYNNAISKGENLAIIFQEQDKVTY